jgi:hypothetical protein
MWVAVELVADQVADRALRSKRPGGNLDGAILNAVVDGDLFVAVIGGKDRHRALGGADLESTSADSVRPGALWRRPGLETRRIDNRVTASPSI